MRAKHVLMAMTLPLAFAACTEDEFVNQGNAGKDNLKRPAVGDVRVAIGENSTTRLVNPVDQTFDWNAGKLGACLMDEISNMSAPFATRYTLVNKVYTDYPFVSVADENGDRVWQSTGYLLEGNYFFYYAQKTKPHMTRDKFSYEIQAEQNAYNNEEKNNKFQPVTDNQIYISYMGLEGGNDFSGSPIDLNLAPLHKQINFSVVYTGASESIKLYQVELIPADVAFATKGYLTVTNTSAVGYEYPVWTEVDGVYSSVLTAGTYGLPALYKEYNNDNVWNTYKEQAAYNPLNVVGAATASETSNSITVKLNDIDVAKAVDKTVSFSMIVPNNDADSYTVKVFTDKGIVTYDAVGTCDYKENSLDFGETTVKLDPTNDYETVEGVESVKEGVAVVASSKLWNNNKAEGSNGFAAVKTIVDKFEADDAQGLVLNFSNKAIKVARNFEVKNTAELELYLGYHDFQAYETMTDIQATLTGDNIVLTKKAYDILKNNSGKFNLVVTAATAKNLTIASDVPADAFHMLGWGDNITAVIAEEGSQTISEDIYSDRDDASTVAVDPTVDEDLNIINKGTLVINHVHEAAAQSTAIANIFNLGTLTVTTPTNASIYNGSAVVSPTYADVVTGTIANINATTGTINNYGTANITVNATVNNMKVAEAGKADKVSTLNIVKDGVEATVDNAGNLVVANAATLNTLTNTGTVNINATTKLVGGSNAGTVNMNAKVDVEGSFTNTGAYNINSGNLAVEAGNEYNNGANGVVTIESGSNIVLLTTNESGKVVIKKRNHNLTIGNLEDDPADYAAAQGIIEYTATDADYENGEFATRNGDKFNKLIVTKGADFTNLKVEGTSVSKTATVVKDLVLNVTADAEFTFANAAELNSLYIGKGTAAVVTFYAPELTINSALTVTNNVTLFVDAGYTINYKGTLENLVNNGEMYFGGIFKAACTKPAGKFLGTGNNYNWGVVF